MGNSDRRNLIDSFFNMNTTAWLSLALAVITFATPALTSEPRVVCYYTNWSVYRPGTAKFNPQNINPYLCTHLIYAFGGFTKENTLKPFDKYQDIEKGGYAKFTGLKTYNKKLKTMLAIGGWNEGSSRFSPMVASKERRKEFVKNAIKFLRQNHFDGLDLDWEYPAFRDGGKPKDREHYARLVRELREEFERESEKTGRLRLLLTMAVPAGIEYIQKGFDIKTLNRYLDWMNLLTYDYHSAFEPAVNHHAPLYPLEEPNEYSVDNELNIDYTIKFYLENGADRDKLVLGIPTYGRSYTLFNADAFEIGSPADGPGEQGDATREKGYLAYYEICEALKPKSKKRSTSDEDSEEESEEEEEEDLPWVVMHPNPSAMGPVAYKGNQWVGYDDTEIVKKKAEYVAENGLGGIMFWSIDNDDFRGTCHGKPYPLIEAAKEAYIVKLGSTDNAIVTDRPRSTTSRSSKRRNRPRSSTTTTVTPSTTTKASKRKSSVTSTTPSWNATPEPPTTPDPGSDFKCTDEGFFQHPRDCKKYFWCLDSGPSNLGIVAHQFTCPSGLFFNKAADSCDFARNVLCKIKAPSPTTKAPTTRATTSTTSTTTTTRRPVKLSTKSSSLFRTTSTTTPEPEVEEEYEDDVEDAADIDAEDPRVIKELIDLIKKVGGVEQLEKHLHLAETSMSTDDAVTTTPSSFNKKLYQKVLERTRGRTKLTGNSLTDSLSQNVRRGPQNAGLDATSDKDKLLRKDRPQYTTINRARASTSAPESEEEETEEEIDEAPQQLSRARAVESQSRVASTAKPLQYVNIRRARPTTVTSDTADDTASRNALFERTETHVTGSNSPSSNSLDIVLPARDNIPEYVTIRRQRPTTEEATTVQYQNTEPEESQETALEREISSPASQPQYTSIVRSRSTTTTTTTTTPTPEEITPEPTTVLAVQISSLLNSRSSSEVEEPETTVEAETTTASTTSRPTTTTTTTTPAPPPTPTRRQILRRRGTTTASTTTSAPVSPTQVSSRNYTFVRRRRPLSQPNEISDSEDTEISRSIRSTTPDSREVDGKTRETGSSRRFRSRFQVQTEDSVADAASPVSRGTYKAHLSRDEVLSLTPIDVNEEIPQFVQRPSSNQRSERRFRFRTSTTIAEQSRADDSEVSAATVEVRRPNILPRGRGRFTPNSTTADLEPTVATESTPSQRRPTFSRFTPRPFARATSVSTTTDDSDDKDDEPVTTQRIPPRLPFGRFRPSSTTAASTGSPLLTRRLPFSSRLATTPQTLTSELEEDEPEENHDEISLSESAIAEKEHEESIDQDEEPQKRRIVIKKLRIPTSSPADNTSPTEAVSVTDDNGKRKFRVIRRRPTSTTEALETSSISTESPSSTPHRIRKIIRKKLRPAENEPAIIAKSIGSLNSALKDTTTEIVVNYGEKSRPTPLSSTEAAITLTTEQKSEHVTESEEIKQETKQDIEKKQEKNKESEEDKKETNTKETKDKEEEKPVDESNKDSETDIKPEVAIETEQKSIDISENKEEPTSIEPTSVEIVPTEAGATETEEPQTESTTTSTTQLTSPSTRSRLPYRPQRRKIFTSTTEAVPSSSRTFSRRFNPGAYTSPATIDKASESDTRQVITRRPLFSSRTFTRRPFTTARTTKKVEVEEEYSDEEILDEEPENGQVLVPYSQLFTRQPNLNNENEEEENLNSEEEEDEASEEEQSINRFPSSRKPIFKPRVVNSNTFRTTSSTTEIPKRLITQNKTSIYSKLGGSKLNDTKIRVQNIPVGYSSPSAGNPKDSATNETKETVNEDKDSEDITTTNASTDQTETTTDDDDYMSVTESGTTIADNTSEDSSSTLDSEAVTAEMEFDDDYLEFTEGTTNYPTTQDSIANTQTEPEVKTTFNDRITTTITDPNVEITTTETVPETTTVTTQAPIIKTQFNKLFSVSRVVEVNSKLDKHRLNKNNETTLVEEGKIMVETKPRVDKIGEVSRFSLIKIYEDEIPIYLTKLGHVYPVENPPDNLIRIDEARNARALVNFADAPRENLIASESMNEAYRHIVNSVTSQPKDEKTPRSQIEHIQNDGFLSYINEDKKVDASKEDRSYSSQWSFVPAAYENEKNRAAKTFEIVTPRSMLNEPSTLPLEALFKTENPEMARKVGGDGNKQPFVVYSASLPTQKEDANIVKLEILKPETGRSIITFAKGQEFHGPPVEQATIKYPINISVVPQTTETTTGTSTTTTITEATTTSPIIQLLTTAPPTTLTTEQQTTVVTTTEAITTETVTEEATTIKSLYDAKRKFAFPRRPIIKPANITRPAPRTVKKINSTVPSNSYQKSNKTSSFSANKNRFSANRAQNVPVDIRKKTNSPKLGTKTFTTEAPRSTTERKLYFKPIRPNLRPSFVPRRNTTPSPQVTGDT